VRIVGGKLGGRRIAGPRGKGTRPTSERVREGIASALESRGWIEGATVLDLFAGTGLLAFEAVSRGAARAVCIDKDPAVASAIRAAAEQLGTADAVSALALDLARAGWIDRLPQLCFDLVFLDPPYDRVEVVAEILTALREGGRLGPNAAIVVEHARRAPPSLPSGFGQVATYRYGDTAVLLGTATEHS
jgi:16S rRNA (guanine966-N2)-methyltransferase